MVLALCFLLAAGLGRCLVLAHVEEHPGVCLHGQLPSAATVAVTNHVSLLSLLVGVLAVGLAMGCILGWKAHGVWASGTSSTSKPFAQSRNVATQSHVRYGWGRADPRFVPLSDRDQGAWSDDELPVTVMT